MNAAELVAALRAEHYESRGYCMGCGDDETMVPAPCLPVIAADRIEAALAVSGAVMEGPFRDIEPLYSRALDGMT